MEQKYIEQFSHYFQTRHKSLSNKMQEEGLIHWLVPCYLKRPLGLFSWIAVQNYFSISLQQTYDTEGWDTVYPEFTHEGLWF